MRLRCARLLAGPQALLRRGVVHGAAEGIAKQKFAWNVLPKHCMPQPENHRPRKVPPHAPLSMGSVDGATKLAAPSTQPPSGRPSEQGRRGRAFSTCCLVANGLLKAFALDYCISSDFFSLIRFYPAPAPGRRLYPLYALFLC